MGVFWFAFLRPRCSTRPSVLCKAGRIPNLISGITMKCGHSTHAPSKFTKPPITQSISLNVFCDKSEGSTPSCRASDMESECFTVRIQDPEGRETKNLLLYPGISGGEVERAIRSAFGLEHQVAGLVNPFLDIYFPLTLFSIAPKYFSKRAPYRIVPEQRRGKGPDVQRVDGPIEDVMVLPNVSLVQLAALRKNLAALPGDTIGQEAFCEILGDTFGEEPQVLTWFKELFTTHETNDDGLVCIAGLLSALPASDNVDRRTIEDEENVSRDSRAECLAGSLEEMLQHIIWAGSTVRQSAPNTPQKPVGPLTPDNERALLECSLAKLRHSMGIEGYPAEKVLSVLCSSAASDGKLTRAEFNSCLKALADTQGLPPLWTANDIFCLFDDTKGGILHVRDLAAGLAVLCDGCMARSVVRACGLYKGGDGGMGFAEIAAFTTSIFKALYAASSEDWDHLGLIPRELAAVVSSEYLARRGLPLSGHASFDSSSDWCAAAASEYIDGIRDARDERDWVHPLEELRKHDIRDILELLSALVDKRGGVSLPAFHGCMRALLEVGGRSIMTDADAAKLKVSLGKLYTILKGGEKGAVPFKDLASGVSTFCGSDKNSKIRAMIRAMIDIHGNEEGSISEEDTKRFFTAVFKVSFEVNPGARCLTGSGSCGEHVDATQLAEKTAAHAFEDAKLNPDGSMSAREFRSWYSSSAGLASPVMSAGETALHLKGDGSSIALDVEEVHRIFKLGDIHVAAFVDGLSATADNGRVSWVAFLRYMCDLADVRLLRAGRRQAVSVAGKIFNLFDEQKHHEVELRVLASGLSMFCKGSWKDRTACLFSLLDTEDRGSLTRKDMQIYCIATFKLLCASEARVGGAAGPNTRANMALSEAFRSEPDENDREPGRFDQLMFGAMYPKVYGRRDGYLVGGSWDGRVEMLLSTHLDQARQCTQLYNTSFARALGICKEIVNVGGHLTRLAVHECFRRVRAMMDNAAQYTETSSRELGEERDDGLAAAVHVMDGLFDALDVCQTGAVGFCEFASGLSTLCGGARDEKMATVFDLFRREEGGSVTVNDVRTYLTSAFRVMFKLQPGLEEHWGISPEALGSVTSMNAVEAVDPDEYDRISPEDLESWLIDGGNPRGKGVTDGKPFGLGLAPLARPDVEQPDGDAPQLREYAEQPYAPALWGIQLKRHGHSMMRARKLLCLDCFNINDLMEMLAEVEVEGSVSLDDFWRCIGYVLQLGGTEEGGADWDEASLLTERIHHAFEDRDDMADFAAITSGISILCSSSVEEKILVALFLFDTDGDGKLTYAEVTMYIASVLRVMHAVSEGVSAISDPDELGSSLATQCFSQAQLSIDAKLGIDDFRLFLG